MIAVSISAVLALASTAERLIGNLAIRSSGTIEQGVVNVRIIGRLPFGL